MTKRPHHLFARHLHAAVLAHQLAIPFKKALDHVPLQPGDPWYALAAALDEGDMVRLEDLVPVQRTAEEMADALTEQLFVNGGGARATRLVLVAEKHGEAPRDLGGWCQQAVRDRVRDAMREAAARAVLAVEKKREEDIGERGVTLSDSPAIESK